MKKILIAAHSGEACTALSGFIERDRYEISTATDGMTIRDIDISRFDIIFISVPLSNESGTALIKQLRSRTDAHIIAIVREDSYEKLCAALSGSGAYIITKPLFKGSLMQAVRFCEIHAENERVLRNRISELERLEREQKLIGRAKLIVMEKKGSTESEAHHLMQQLAMSLRVPLPQVAEDIINGLLI